MTAIRSPADWLNASQSNRAAWRDETSARVPPQFQAERLDKAAPTMEAYRFPEFTHRPTGTRWVCIPGGAYSMGFSQAEEAAARRIEDPPALTMDEMRPVHEVDVETFLVMKAPMSWALAESIIGPCDSAERPMLGKDRASAPAYLTRQEIDSLCESVGFTLPMEQQWEYLCRGNTKTLFFFGDDLPRTDQALANLVDYRKRGARLNPFGLAGLFVGEWCSDKFHERYDEPSPTEDFVVRGGASLFWPWQSSEWTFCVSAMRMPSSALFDGTCGARLVCALEPH